MFKSLLNICRDENIHVKETTENDSMYEDVVSHGGALALNVSNGDRFIFLASKQGVWERKLCVAHELAHHLFGHLKKDKVTKSDELEAQIFSIVYVALQMFSSHEV